MLLLALVGVAVAHALGLFSGPPPTITAAPTPTVTATPTPNPTQQVPAVATRFGNDMVRDDGADAFTLLTPQAQAQTTPQQLTNTLKPPPNFVNDAFAIDPTSVMVTGTQATVRGTLTVTYTPNSNRSQVLLEFQLAQQSDGSWRVASFHSVSAEAHGSTPSGSVPRRAS